MCVVCVCVHAMCVSVCVRACACLCVCVVCVCARVCECVCCCVRVCMRCLCTIKDILNIFGIALKWNYCKYTLNILHLKTGVMKRSYNSYTKVTLKHILDFDF